MNINTQMLTLILLATLVARVYSTTVCEACNCTILGDSIELINCSSRGLRQNFPNMNQWPNEAKSSNTKNSSQVNVQVSVNLARNSLHRVEQFPYLPGVVRLSLRHNVILDIATHAFAKLDFLTHLDLSYNQLTGDSVRADVLRGSYRDEEYEPMEVISLSLAFNNIHSLEMNAFLHLPRLQELDLSGNPLKVLDVATTTALSRLSAIKILDLSATGLSQLTEEFVHLSSLRNHLQVLALSANNFTEIPGQLSALGSSLEELNMNGNPVRELGEGSFLGLRRVHTLSISGMPYLKRIGPAAFDELDNLTVLYAAHNPRLIDIDTDAFRQFRTFSTLKEVYLEDNVLDWLPKTLLPWDQLEILDIQSNPWLCDCELQWMTSELVPLISEKDPEHAIELHCEAPQSLAGVNLLVLSREPDKGKHVLCTPEPRERMHPRRLKSRSIAATLILAIGVFMICFGTVITCFICYRRLRLWSPIVQGSVVYVPVRENGNY